MNFSGTMRLFWDMEMSKTNQIFRLLRPSVRCSQFVNVNVRSISTCKGYVNRSTKFYKWSFLNFDISEITKRLKRIDTFNVIIYW